MRKMIISLLIVMSISLAGAIPQEEVEPLHTLAQIAKTNKLPLTGWEVVMKETLPASNFKHLVNNAENSHLVTVTEDENSIKYDGVSGLEFDSIEVQEQLVLDKNNQEQVELSVVLSGTEWNKEIREVYDEVKRYFEQNYFGNKKQSFTCIQVTDGDIIENRAVINLFQESLGLVHIEEQTESIELSKLKKVFYGYTPLWNDEFVIHGIPYNFQFAASETENGEWAYTIGTPILVNEY